jgi:hypothetical protein
MAGFGQVLIKDKKSVLNKVCLKISMKMGISKPSIQSAE